MKHIELNCNSLAECYARARELISLSDLCLPAKVTIEIDTDGPYDSSYIKIPSYESKEDSKAPEAD